MCIRDSDQAEWKRLTDMVTDSLMNGRSGYNLVTPLRRRNGEYIWVKFSAAFSDEYVDGYQVAYTVMTNIDDLVRMQKEQSVTYDNIPGFVAKFCLRGDGLHLLDANDRFRAFFGCEGQCGPACGLSNLDTVQNLSLIHIFRSERHRGPFHGFFLRHLCHPVLLPILEPAC